MLHPSLSFHPWIVHFLPGTCFTCARQTSVLANREMQPVRRMAASSANGRRGAAARPAASRWVERFDRRGIEPFEPFEPFEPCEFFQNSEIFPRKFKNFRKFQHFLNYRRNSDKISSKSEQKSMKRIQK